MMTFLFWNICGVASIQERKGETPRPLRSTDRRYRNLQRLLRILAGRHSIDVIILAESPFAGNTPVRGFQKAINTLPPNAKTKGELEVYHRPEIVFPSFQTLDRAVIYEMNTSTIAGSLLLTTVHLDSGLHINESTRTRYVEVLAREIRRAEESYQSKNTVVVGDFNFDPQDKPLTDAYGMNAVRSKEIARLQTRHLRHDSIPYFYNPMWAHLSDITDSPPGTYYRKTKEVDCPFWHLPDQVLLRPDLLPVWQDTELIVATQAGKRRLVDRHGRPDRKRASDHLPLLFRLNLR